MKKFTLYAGLSLVLATSGLANNKYIRTENGKAQFVMPANVTKDDYLARTIIFKVKDQYRSSCQVKGLSVEPINTVMQQLGADKVQKMYPFSKAPVEKRNKLNQEYADLTLIYQLTYTNNVDLELAINNLIRTGAVEYAQPYYVQRYNYTPNDQNTSSQSYLTNIKAYEAWDINKGDTNVVIGIVDSGTDLDHPDLLANFKRNWADPVNGVDDDQDGYIDNFYGWDLAGGDYNNIVGDNDPDIKGSNQSHGAHVSGDASAVADNGKGVAGVGFKCKLLPVKCGADNDTRGSGGVGYILTGYQGITYAADHGANVINCSWGGAGGGPYEQEIIRYATINKGALVVAAAGNDNVDTQYAPAGLEYVINIAATNSSDAKASFSNYGFTIDMCAPGNNIYSTQYSTSTTSNLYGSSSGTSMASPVAAGCAAIVKSHFPSYSMLQVGEQLRATCDNIYSLNTSYNNKLGSGRINLYKALTTSIPSIRKQNVLVKDNNDNAIVANDSMRISMDFINYLAPTSSAAKVVLSAQVGGSYVTILNNTVNLGVINTLGLLNNVSSPFLVKVKSTAPSNYKVTFKLTYTDATNSYSAIEFFDVYINVDYININVNQVGTSITSKGRISYNGAQQAQGMGFTYNGINLVYESGLMIGSGGNVSDMVRNNSGSADEDFKSVQVVKQIMTNPVSGFDAYGKFNDQLNSKGALPVEVKHWAHAWYTAPDDKYIMVRYVIKNTGTVALNNVYAGIFTDFDIDDYNQNKGDEDAINKLGYTYATTAVGTYGGVKLLSPTPFIHHAVDNVNGANGGPIDFTNGSDFDLKKDSAMRISRAQAGMASATGNDILQVVSTGPFNIASGDSVEVAFALIAGDNLADIQGSSMAAQTKYDSLFGTTAIKAAEAVNYGLANVFPNPSNGLTNVAFALEKAGNISIEVYNMAGQQVFSIVNKEFAAGYNKVSLDLSNLESGAYLVRFVNGNEAQMQKLNIVK